jgi:hypothetical protein
MDSFQLVERIQKETNTNIKEGLLGCVSSLIRRESLKAIRIFFKLNR